MCDDRVTKIYCDAATRGRLVEHAFPSHPALWRSAGGRQAQVGRQPVQQHLHGDGYQQHAHQALDGGQRGNLARGNVNHETGELLAFNTE